MAVLRQGSVGSAGSENKEKNSNGGIGVNASGGSLLAPISDIAIIWAEIEVSKAIWVIWVNSPFRRMFLISSHLRS